jgi:hypothetical protein
MSGLRRAALVFGILGLLLIADGAYLVATHNNPNGDTGTLFGNQHYFLSSGTIVLISGLLVLVVAVTMWLIDVQRADKERALRSAGGRQPAREQQPAEERRPAGDPPTPKQPEPSSQPASREQPGPSGRTASPA